jgi:hypothetical protein
MISFFSGYPSRFVDRYYSYVQFKIYVTGNSKCPERHAKFLCFWHWHSLNAFKYKVVVVNIGLIIVLRSFTFPVCWNVPLIGNAMRNLVFGPMSRQKLSLFILYC